ncbi:TPA: hypothetical protein ACT2IN_002096 [Streptococcus suis]|nr:hypothetical protein [Streptococcus suis]HEP1835778.1 hypothetical protein [Streptococcus suis]
MKKIILLFVALVSLFVFQNNVSADTLDDNIPQMTLSEALKSGEKEVIITEIDIPEAAKVLNSIRMRMPRSAGGDWVYMYTAEPYAFYRHSKTKKWKMVQVTPTWTHVQNTVVNGWISSMAGGYDYATSFGQRKP